MKWKIHVKQRQHQHKDVISILSKVTESSEPKLLALLFFFLHLFKNSFSFRFIVAFDKMSEEWCRQQLMNLQIKDRRMDTLNEIRNHLTKLPADEVASVSSNFLTLSELFDCVEDNQERYFFQIVYDTFCFNRSITFCF